MSSAFPTTTEDSDDENRLSAIDTVIVIVYIVGIFGVGMYAYIIQRRQTTKQAESYFLASRDVLWLAVGATLFSSNIGAEHFVGLSGSSAKSGIAVGSYEWTAPFLLVVQGYFTAQVYRSSNIVTTPEYLEYRFNRVVRVYNAFITLFIYIFVVISSTLYAGAVILNTLLGWGIYVSSISLITATGCYVVLGGLRAVVYTENVQTVILLIGGFFVMAYSLAEVGGLQGLFDRKEDYPENYKDTYSHLMRPLDDPDWPWVGITVGIITQSYYYWCGNHLIIQRVLSAKTTLHAKYGATVACFLKILPVWMMCVPGMIAPMIYPEEFANDEPNEYDQAFPLLVIRLLPPGITGLVVASMLSALMSSLAAVYNSAATVIVNDLYKLVLERTGVTIDDQKLVYIGRISSIGFVCISVLWLPVIQNSEDELFSYLQSILSVIQTPLAAIYFIGTFWNRANVIGAYCGIVVSFILGFTRFVMQFGTEEFCNQQTYCSMNFLYFALIILACTTVAMVFGSLVTNPPPQEKIYNLTYWSVRKILKEKKMNEMVPQTSAGVQQSSVDVEMDEVNVESNAGKTDDKETGGDDKEKLTDKEEKDYDNNANRKCQWFWDFIYLKDDEDHPLWNIIINVSTAIAMLALISQWIMWW